MTDHLFSDGLISRAWENIPPFGWGIDGVNSAVLHQERNPDICQKSGKTLVNKVLENDGWQWG